MDAKAPLVAAPASPNVTSTAPASGGDPGLVSTAGGVSASPAIARWRRLQVAVSVCVLLVGVLTTGLVIGLVWRSERSSAVSVVNESADEATQLLLRCVQVRLCSVVWCVRCGE